MNPIILQLLDKFEKGKEIKAEEFCSFFSELKKLEKSDQDNVCDKKIAHCLAG